MSAKAVFSCFLKNDPYPPPKVQTLELIRPLRVRTDCMLPSGLMVVDSVLVLFHWVSQVKSIIRLSKGRKRAPTVTTDRKSVEEEIMRDLGRRVDGEIR